MAPPHLLNEDEVATATNIDFALERGAAHVRRGSAKEWTVSAGAPIRYIYRSLKNSLASSPFYVYAGTAIYRGLSGTFTPIATGLTNDPEVRAGFTSYRNYAFIAVSTATKCIKDDGTNATDWIKQAPATGPIFGYTAQSVKNVVTTYTLTEGTHTTNTTINTFTGTAVAAGEIYRLAFEGTPVGTGLDDISGNKIGDLGFHSIRLAFSNPSSVKRIVQEYSVDDASFASEYRAELDLENKVGDFKESISNLIRTNATTWEMQRAAGLRAGSDPGRERRWAGEDIPEASNVYAPWIVPRTQFRYINIAAGPEGWKDVKRVRFVLEADSPVVVLMDDWDILGASNSPLTDEIGYVWRETWACLDSSGYVIEESAPSPPTDRYPLFAAQAVIYSTNAPTGNHGITHRLLYRQGTLLPRPYMVQTATIALPGNGTATWANQISDQDALLNNQSLQSFDAHSRATFPNNVIVASEPFYDRIVVAETNKIYWSFPGTPDIFLRASETDVSHTGDEVYGLIVWPPGMIVVNRDSVYEWHGNIFEGDDQDWVLTRSGSRHGSYASKTIVKTPYGIPLLNPEGIFLYLPGQGIDQPIDWAMEYLRDAFLGATTGDPVAIKGNRIPAINLGSLRGSVAAFRDDKLYLGIPTGANTLPSTVFVLDFSAKKVQWYTYPWTFESLAWDPVDSAMRVGTPDGVIMRIDNGSSDQLTTGTDTGVVWSIRTRAWTAPTDTVLENISALHKGGTSTLLAIYDSTSTATISTMYSTYTASKWSTPTLGGTICNNVVFSFQGTQTAGEPTALYAIQWDALSEPKRVVFWRTEHEIPNEAGESLWDVHNVDIDIIDTGSVLGTAYVDNVATMTTTYIGPTNGRRQFPNAYPSETYGEVGYTVYNAGTGVVFKHWRTFSAARPEPPRVNFWKTDVVSLEENRAAAVDFDVNPNGTLTGVTFVDNTAVTTFTATGTSRQSYTRAHPPETYGRTIYTTYTGTAFKHYNTWDHLEPEPDRLSTVQVGPIPYPSDQNLRTWVAVLNPLGTATGVLYANGTATHTATFIGTRRTTFSVGLDLNLSSISPQVAVDVKVVYGAVGASAVLKHYDTKFETETQPFGKKTWLIRYQKLGGASQLDIGRFFALDIEPEGTATITSFWDVDGVAAATNTLTFTAREWRDRISFPPEARGYNFQQRLVGAQNFKVWKSSLDMVRVGIKGLARITVPGTPE